MVPNARSSLLVMRFHCTTLTISPNHLLRLLIPSHWCTMSCFPKPRLIVNHSHQQSSNSSSLFLKLWIGFNRGLINWLVWDIYTGWPNKNGTIDTVNFSGLCSDQQLSFFTLLDRASFPHYNNTKIIKFGWELFILWVISYGLSFSGFARFP